MKERGHHDTRRYPVNIRTRLMALVLLATLLPAVLIGLRFFQDRRKRRVGHADLETAANGLALRISNRIQGTTQLHTGWRDQGPRHNRQNRLFFLSVRGAGGNPQYTGILTITPDGQLFCDSLLTGRELDLRDRGYFKEAPYTTDGVTLEPVFGKLTGIAVLQIAYPVRAEFRCSEVRPSCVAEPGRSGKAVHERTSPRQGSRSHLPTVRVKFSSGSRLRDWKHRIGQSIADTDLFQISESNPGGGVNDIDRPRWKPARFGLSLVFLK